MMMRSMFVCLLGAALVAASCRSPADWRSRTIYFLMTDRFGGGTDMGTDCIQNAQYCGGNFQGLVDKLDYIQDMGFDAIWITPVIENTEGGYHGYWGKNFSAVNPQFGGSYSLKNLVAECHKRNVWVMIDVVANHIGYIGNNDPQSSFDPFNSNDHYHSCDQCGSGCGDMNDQWHKENCRLAGLPDLNQQNSWVSMQLNKWIGWLLATYDFDGVRVDTTANVQKDFWSVFSKSANDSTGAHCFTIGEVFNGDPSYSSSYQGSLDSVLHYPFYYTLLDVFKSKNSMYKIQSDLQIFQKDYSDTSVLGLFIDNHDNPRFLSEQSDVKLYANALVHVLLSEGIPIVYYGSEQEYNGGNDPWNRKPLWQSGWKTDSMIYGLIKKVNAVRSTYSGFANQPAVQRYAQNDFYAWTRGDVLIMTTNVGSSGPQVSYNVTYLPDSYTVGKKFCNIFYPTTDCLNLEQGGDGKPVFPAILDNGEAKIFVPSN
eukprot:TRINITY_DN1765_c1_g2_i3.p1 TRINITY_DN1765_c1_g2~~TRINITY_DN1765_c1_g2_i3.p1  ORF type:complete len:491 (+),score=168.29 TRINITY_DN1765_c1_g2_i3:27-1475(+)